MAEERAAILEYLKRWAVEVIDGCKLKTIYLFGSILQDDGELFDLRKGDVDLLVLFAGSEAHPLQRVEACRSLVPHIQRLEQSLKEQWLDGRVRERPLMSVGAVTDFELERGINIKGDPKFISANTFLALDTGQAYHRGLGQTHGSLHRDVEQVLQKCQECRKEFLWVTADGRRKVRDLLDAEEFLKDLGRSLAKFRDHVKPTSRRYDVPSGLAHLASLLSETAEVAEFVAIQRKLFARMYGRSVALSSLDQLLLWETVASSAMGPPNLELQTRTAQVTPKEAITLHQPSSRPSYSLGSASAESIRVVGGADESFSREVVHISYAETRYVIPHEIV